MPDPDRAHICDKCRGYLGRPSVATTAVSATTIAAATAATSPSVNIDDYTNDTTTTTAASTAESVCTVCLDLWKTNDARQKIRAVIETACEPYGGLTRNRFSQLPNQAPTISIAGDIYVRYKWFAISSSSSSSTAFAVYLQDLKQHLQVLLKEILNRPQGDCDDNSLCDWIDDETGCQEEQGYLTLHLLCLPSKDMVPTLDPNHLPSSKKKRKRQRPRPFVTQGGHPQTNLETRLQQRGYTWMTMAAVQALPPSCLDGPEQPNDPRSAFPSTPMAMEFHVAVHRRPIFLYGYYTKSRRDVSQTPFVVMREDRGSTDNNNDGDDDAKTDDQKREKGSANEGDPSSRPPHKKKGKRAETLGVTSVDEQICGPIIDLLGVSTVNNLPTCSHQNAKDRIEGGGGGGGGVKYGMCKFHASGREDMDVRMLVRQYSPTCRGRPFCIQIIDALHPLRSKTQLQDLIHTVNHTSNENESDEVDQQQNKNDVGNDPNENNVDTIISYGRNPLGVGISPTTFKIVPSSVFSGLQEDTESKVKHYGSICWSQRVLPKAENDNDGNDLTKIIFPPDRVTFPLTLRQKTPLRVLHRRANTVRERQVLQVRAIRIDDHHFRLEMSTQAGTYVKEFVYGDLGRTQPSVASLLGCKATLLHLDCEGIEMDSK